MRKFIMESGKQPISTVDFEDIEKKYNVIFPKDFKEFYLENNGL